MDAKIVQVEPVEVITVKYRHSFRIRVMNMQIFESVSLFIEFFDENERLIDTGSVELTGLDYSNWGADDNYLVNYVATKYGMQLKK